MKRAAVCIDDWKLSIFVDELTKAGFKFEQHAGVTHDTLTLTVYTETIAELAPVVKAANYRAAEAKRLGLEGPK